MINTHHADKLGSLTITTSTSAFVDGMKRRRRSSAILIDGNGMCHFSLHCLATFNELNYY